MNETRSAVELNETCARKLAAVKCSGKFKAILACLLNVTWTTPALAELCITSDGILMGRTAGDIGFNEFLGGREDLIRNVRGISTVAVLDLDEAAYMLDLVAGVTRF